MSNSITISASLSYAISGGGSMNGSGGQSLSQSGTHAISNVQSIATSATAIALGSLANAGFIMIRNLDSTNYVEIDAVNTFNSFPQKILPEGFILLSPETTTIYGKAHTGACDCEITAGEL